MKAARVWGQCLDYALTQWNTIGGRLDFRRSEHWPIAHAEHSNDQSELRHFTPPGDLKTPLHALIGYHGEVLHHDMAPCRPMPVWGIVVSAVLLLFGVLFWAAKTTIKKLFRSYP